MIKNIDIIVPVFNEADSIEELTKRIHTTLKPRKIAYNIIFVDDNSTDSSEKVIKSLQRVYPITYLKKKGKQGKAYCILEASRVAKAKHLVMIDGDLQYPPEAIPNMLKLAEEHGVVVANRRKHNTSKLRKLLSKANSILFGKVLMGFECDAQSGLKLFKREIINHLTEKDVKPWALDMPLLHAANEMGEKIGCVEIDFSERQKGISKVNIVKTTSEIVSTALKLKLKSSRTYTIEPDKNIGLIGKGVAFKKRKFITHTSLPHHHSALQTFTRGQKMFLIMLLALIALGFILNLKLTVIAVIAILTLIYFIDMVFSGFVLLKSLHFPPELSFKDSEINKLKDRDLPLYTILCPLYREGNVIEEFIESIDKLDWPKNKLEVLLLLEEDDKETIDVAKSLNLPLYVKILVVPDSQPKTKPKACNYGLALAKGEYSVIYDAEDKPEPLQLKKAYLGFQNSDDKTICLQSKLNYFNPHHNLLTRLFTAEYSLWFDVVLPGLQSIESSIPLGGTSNHFKTNDLRGLHAWDPFNVTEDCDLGVRIFKSGYKTAIIDSTTYEEANSNVKNWIRQRSRWIKGYLQTYLVHMRNPLSFVMSHGIHAFIFQLIIGMRMTFMVINPFLWLATILYFAAYSIVGEAIESVYPPAVFYLAAASLVFGNFMYVYNYMIGAAKREHYSVIKYVFLIPLYWILSSVAASMAFYQLIVKPHYWEKTNHGLVGGKSKEIEKKLKPTEVEKVEKPKSANFKIPALNSAFAQGGLLVIAGGIANLLNLTYNAYLGRAVPVAEFGLISLIGGIFAFSGVLSSAIGKTVTYKAAHFLGKSKSINKSFWRKIRLNGLLLGLLATAIWLVLTPSLASFFKSSSTLPFLLFAPVFLVTFASFIDRGFLSGNHKFVFLAVVILTEAIIKLVSAVFLVSLNQVSLVYSSIPLSIVLSFLIGWLFISRLSESRSSKKNKDTKTPTGFLTSSILLEISIVSFLTIDLVLAKHYLSPELAGQYSLLSLAGKIVFFFGTTFTRFVNPVISKNLGSKEDTRAIFYKLLALVTVSSYFAFFVIGLFGHITIPFIFGDKSAPIIPLLPAYAFGMTSFAIATTIVTYHMVKKQYIFPIISFLTAIAQNILLLIVFKSLLNFSLVISIIGVAYLLAVLILHLVSGYSKVFSDNLTSLTNLFSSKTPAPEPSKNDGVMNILMFNWRDTKHVWAGGAEVYVHEIAKQFVKKGHNVTLFAGNDGKNKHNEVVDGVNVVRRGGFYTVYLWAFLYYIFRFRKKFNLIIESENGLPFFTPIYSRLPKILIVHHVHQEVFRKHLIFPLSLVASFIESQLMPLVYKNQEVIAVSNSTKKDLVNRNLINKEKITVINPGVHLPNKSFKKYKNPTFVFIGRHKQYKNIDVALEAFKLVVKDEPKARFLIAGTGEETSKLKRHAEKLNLNGQVKFLGKISEENKIKLLSKSWVSLQPSSFEGWGITVIEANSCKTPVIASNVNGLKDSVDNQTTGLLVKPGNPRELAQAMNYLIKNKKVLKQMSTNAYYWSNYFEWDRIGQKFIKESQKVFKDSHKISVSPKLAINKN